MRYEILFFTAMIAIGLTAKRLDWRGLFFLLMFVSLWVFINWRKG